eukprot:330557-Rhodomonas_salina.2
MYGPTKSRHPRFPHTVHQILVAERGSGHSIPIPKLAQSLRRQNPSHRDAEQLLELPEIRNVLELEDVRSVGQVQHDVDPVGPAQLQGFEAEVSAMPISDEDKRILDKH